MLCGKVPHGVFEPPSHRVECDTRVDQVVTRAMQQEPRLRYQSTQEMKTDVDAARTPLEKAESKSSRTRVAAIVAAGLVLVSAAVFFLWEKRNASRAARAESSPALQRVEPSATTGRPDGLKPATTLPAATADAPFVNTLGMKFIPVPIVGGSSAGQRGSPEGTGLPLFPGAAASVLISVWDTRVQDYATFATETQRAWPKPEFEQGPTHPAVMVSWDDATAFCAWLTERERKAGKLGAKERYRLPGDHEWSCAVGIGEREDAAKLPTQKHTKLGDPYPWDNTWPPPDNTGNYWSEELQPAREARKCSWIQKPPEIPGYHDGFAETSPVDAFAANRFGLHDMGGNVWQWCEDWFDAEHTGRVLRGACG